MHAFAGPNGPTRSWSMTVAVVCTASYPPPITMVSSPAPCAAEAGRAVGVGCCWGRGTNAGTEAAGTAGAEALAAAAAAVPAAARQQQPPTHGSQLNDHGLEHGGGRAGRRAQGCDQILGVISADHSIGDGIIHGALQGGGGERQRAGGGSPRAWRGCTCTSRLASRRPSWACLSCM